MIMKKVSLLKPLLLLFALIVGSSSAWATDVLTFDCGAAAQTGTASTPLTADGIATFLNSAAGLTDQITCSSKTGDVYNGKGSGGGDIPQQCLKVGKASGGGGFTFTIPDTYDTVNEIEITCWGWKTSSSIKINGGTAQTFATAQVETTKTFELSTATREFTISVTSSAVCITNIVLKKKTSSSIAAPTFSLAEGTYNGEQSVTITTNEPGGTTYYTIDGSTPDNTKTVATASPISINGSLTLKAITYKGENTSSVVSATYNIFYVTDGEFDFVSAGEVGEDYGSGVSTTSDGSFYEEEAKTWTAGFVTMVTDGRYRWWNADKTLRFYSNTPKSSATFSVPDGSVIVNIKIEGGSNFTSTPASGSANVKKFIVTYLPENVILFPAKEYTTYVTPAAMDFTGVSGLKAFVATAAASTGVTLTEPAAAVPAKTPLVLKKVSGTSFEVPVVASGTAPATNMLKAGPATMTGDGTEYILIDGLFYQSTAGALATGKAYLKTASALGRELTINWGDETAIRSLTPTLSEGEGVWYDLSGRRVENPTKGIYIMNGKKVIFK